MHFFAVVLHDYNVASRNFLVTRFKKEMLYAFLFTFLFAVHLGAASISHFLTAVIKFSCCSYDEIGLLCFLSLTLALSLLSTSMQTLKFKSEERIGFVVVVFSLKVRVAMRFTAEPAGTWNRIFQSGLHEGVDVRTYFLQNPNFLDAFLPMVLHCARFARARAPLK